MKCRWLYCSFEHEVRFFVHACNRVDVFMSDQVYCTVIVCSVWCLLLCGHCTVQDLLGSSSAKGIGWAGDILETLTMRTLCSGSCTR